MGKDNLLIGTARGKLGDVVFYRTGGEQRFRARVRPANPQTNAQLLQRVVMSTAVKAYSSYAYVCDHAFQNFEGPLKNHQRFMRLNAKLLREVALSNVESWSPLKFNFIQHGNWNAKDSVNCMLNEYVISEGDLPGIEIGWDEVTSIGRGFFPQIDIVYPKSSGYSNAVEQMTYQDFVDWLGLQAGDQVTSVIQTSIDNSGIADATYISRFITMPSDGDMSSKMWSMVNDSWYTLNKPNKENYGPMNFYLSESSRDANYGIITITLIPNRNYDAWGQYAAAGIIVSRFENKMWRRSNSQMNVYTTFQNSQRLAAAMASYLRDTTSSLYLNQAQLSAAEDEMIPLAANETVQIDTSQENAAKRKKKTNVDTEY